MPFKDFAAGDVLTAADVDNLLMRQTVMTFADETARDTALAAVLAEGMIAYLDDTDEVLKYTGSAWVNVSNPGDITAVAAGYGLSGGGTVGDVTLSASTTLTSSTATTYTVQDSDAGNYLRFTAAATVTVGTATDFSPGQQVQIFADGAALAITGGTGVTLGAAGTAGTALTFVVGNQFEAVSVFCVDTNTYRVIGNVSVPE